MDEPRIGHFRGLLVAVRDELQASLEAESDDSKPVGPDPSIGRLTRQDAMQAQQMALEIKRRSKARLAQVGLALERVEHGTYGYCTRCEEEISEARLAVRPEAPACIRWPTRGRASNGLISTLLRFSRFVRRARGQLEPRSESSC